MKTLKIFFSAIAFILVANMVAAQSLVDLLTLKKGKPRTYNEQVQVLKKWKVEPTTFLFNENLLDSMGGSLQYTLDTHMYKWKNFSPIQFRVYDNNGDLYTGWEYCFGNLKKLKVLQTDSIRNVEWMPVNRELTLQANTDLIVNGEQISDKINDYDYTILAFWDPSFGRASKKMLQRLEKFKKRSKNKKIRIIKVNYNGVV